MAKPQGEIVIERSKFIESMPIGTVAERDEVRKQIQKLQFHLRSLEELGIVNVKIIDEIKVIGRRIPTTIQVATTHPIPVDAVMPDKNLMSRSQMQQYIREYDDTVVRLLLNGGYVQQVKRIGSNRLWLELTEKGKTIGIQKGRTMQFYFDKTVKALGLTVGQKG